jgi:hypothetical protein
MFEAGWPGPGERFTKKLAIVLIGLTAGLGVQAAAQGQVERFAYNPAANHDFDGDSNGTSIK